MPHDDQRLDSAAADQVDPSMTSARQSWPPKAVSAIEEILPVLQVQARGSARAD